MTGLGCFGRLALRHIRYIGLLLMLLPADDIKEPRSTADGLSPFGEGFLRGVKYRAIFLCVGVGVCFEIRQCQKDQCKKKLRAPFPSPLTPPLTRSSNSLLLLLF